MRPDVDNHWALRDFASRLLSQICKNFNTTTNNVQTRVTQLLSQSLDRDRLPMASFYGALSGLCELGPEVQRTFLFKRLKPIGERIRVYFENSNMPSADKSAAEHIKQLIIRVLPTTLKVLILYHVFVTQLVNSFLINFFIPNRHLVLRPI